MLCRSRRAWLSVNQRVNGNTERRLVHAADLKHSVADFGKA
jgi:hypothetical protein